MDGPLILQGQEKKLGSGPISLQGLQALGLHRCLVRPVTYPCKNLLFSAGESWYREKLQLLFDSQACSPSFLTKNIAGQQKNKVKQNIVSS